MKLSERVIDTRTYYPGHSILNVVPKWFDLWPCPAETSPCMAYKTLTWPSAHLYIKGKLIVLLITRGTTPSAAVTIANKHILDTLIVLERIKIVLIENVGKKVVIYYCSCLDSSFVVCVSVFDALEPFSLLKPPLPSG